jgi:transcriptional regulator with GAF, ATPase, and Fis domain
MDIGAWLEERGTIGTVAELARRVASCNCGDVDRDLRRLRVLEVLIANDGNHAAAAKSLGAHRHTIARCLRDLDLTSGQVREIAKRIKGAENHASN